MIISRQEYCDQLEKICPGISRSDSGVWVPEQQFPMNPSHWFISIKPIGNYSSCFWDECRANMLVI